MLISIITPSIRKKGVDITAECLKKQTFKNWEWIVCSPYLPPNNAVWIPEPKKKEGNTYSLNACWNMCIKRACGKLIVSIVDLTWFTPDVLERLWGHYEANPRACIGTIGHQYDKMDNGKPVNMVWQDPRARNDFGTFYEINPNDLELCVASIPKKALYEVGGFDEEFDKYAALSEKELAFRLKAAGYSIYLDQSIEYRAIKHPRLTKNWDERYHAGEEYYFKCLYEIENGIRKVDYL